MLLACCLRGVHDMKDSNLLFAPAVPSSASSVASFASMKLVPGGSLHAF